MYLCYCAIFLDKTCRNLTNAVLYNKPSLEAKNSNINNIAFLFSLVFVSLASRPHNIFCSGQISPGFYLDMVGNINDSFLYEILTVRDVPDIPLCYHYPVVCSIICPRAFNCSNAQSLRQQINILLPETRRTRDYFLRQS